MHDTELAIAELKRQKIMVEHHLRHIQANGDVTGALAYVELLTQMAEYAQKVKWLMYCHYCKTEHRLLLKSTVACPNCGRYRMRY